MDDRDLTVLLGSFIGFYLALRGGQVIGAKCIGLHVQ